LDGNSILLEYDKGSLKRISTRGDGFTGFDITNNVGEDRVLKCTIPIMVDGYLQNQFDLKESTVQKRFTIKRVDFSSEETDEGFYVDYKPKILAPAKSRIWKDILNNPEENDF
jgi:hypothetical protein